MVVGLQWVRTPLHTHAAFRQVPASWAMRSGMRVSDESGVMGAAKVLSPGRQHR